MTDIGYLMAHRLRPVDPYTVPPDGGIEAARMLRVAALLGIAARLFWIWASAHRISVAHTLLGLLDANGRIVLIGRTDGGAGLVAKGNDADALVKLAFWASAIVFILFFVAMVSLIRRKRRGDPLAAAINKNRAVLLAGYLYVLASVASGAATNAFNPSPDASPADRLHTTVGLDTTNIGIQIVMITILLLVALATGREIGKARAEGRIG